MSDHFLMWGWCENCEATRDLTTAARCASCGSDAIVVREKHALPAPSVIDEMLELEKMYRLSK